jgi:3-hydroxybutyryl-CoA dehydrogenase
MKIAVIGAGTMGRGIAHVCAARGHQVSLKDVDSKVLSNSMELIRRGLEKSLERESGEMGSVATLLDRIQPTTGWENTARSEMVIEAVVEIFEVKREIFRKLGDLCDPGVILASNTSSIPITRLAAVTKRPERVIGMHFMNPVPRMKLVEVIRGLQTDQQTVDSTVALAKQLGKVPVEVRDFPGFVTNRILMPMINEAVTALMEGVAEAEGIDRIMQLGMNHPMGPLRLADLIGLDVCLHVMEVLFDGFKDPKYRPCPLLRQMVDAGWLGRKTGRGFYTYPGLGAGQPGDSR